jgi:hypothetical protein
MTMLCPPAGFPAMGEPWLPEEVQAASVSANPAQATRNIA